MSGRRSNVAVSISTPVESSCPVVGHLTMTTLAWPMRDASPPRFQPSSRALSLATLPSFELGVSAKKDIQQCLTSSLLFGAAMAERNSERTGLLSQGTRGTLERSRDGFYARPVF